jgi:hypothetical protein
MNAANSQGAARIGRQMGIALFWCMAVFVISASARSVLGELYGTPTPLAAGDDAVSCAAVLDGLHRSLIQQASAELRLPRDAARLRTWLRDWDKKYAITRDQCASLHETRRTLLALRERVEALLHTYARDELPLTERIARELKRFTSRSTPPSET